MVIVVICTNLANELGHHLVYRESQRSPFLFSHRQAASEPAEVFTLPYVRRSCRWELGKRNVDLETRIMNDIYELFVINDMIW